MNSVRAFQPRKYDPPRFVAEDLAELEEREGEYIGGGQCDGCGNSSYRIERGTEATATRRVWEFVAVCAVDPDDPDEYKHSDPCGTAYPVNIWEEDLVEF